RAARPPETTASGTLRARLHAQVERISTRVWRGLPPTDDHVRLWRWLMSTQIPSAFLIRALARRPSEHCDRCGHRMFVKQASGLCPFCRSDRPVRPIEYAARHVGARESAAARVAPKEPFAPLVGERAGWQQVGLGRRMRELVARSRRSAKV